MLDNFRLIFTAEKSRSRFLPGAEGFRTVTDAPGAEMPRVCLVARGYLQAGGLRLPGDRARQRFWRDIRNSAELDMGEVWALKTALLQLELIDRLTEADSIQWPVLVTSLKRLDEAVMEGILRVSEPGAPRASPRPGGRLLGMDFDSRSRYRANSPTWPSMPRSEIETAQAATRPARAGADGRGGPRDAPCGYYLVDRDVAHSSRRSCARRCWTRITAVHPAPSHRLLSLAIELITLGIVFGSCTSRGSILRPTPGCYW